jgi:hypothetical protein
MVRSVSNQFTLYTSLSGLIVAVIGAGMFLFGRFYPGNDTFPLRPLREIHSAAAEAAGLLRFPKYGKGMKRVLYDPPTSLIWIGKPVQITRESVIN